MARGERNTKTMDRRGFLKAALGAAVVLSGGGLTSAASPGGAARRLTGFLAKGTLWENPYHITDSGVPGPTLLVTAGVHGNEPAGSRAAEQIGHWPVRRGRLIVVPRVNAPGLKSNSRWLPGEGEPTRNANRNFPKAGQPNRARTAVVRALWEFIQKQKPTWVVDLHEGYDFHVANPKSDGSSIIFPNTPGMRALAKKIQHDVNATIVDPKRRIVLLSGGPVDGGLVRATIERTGAKGFCFETTFNHQPVSVRTRQHRIMVHRLLRELDMAAGGPHVMTPGRQTNQVQVALYDAGGTGGNGAKNLAGILDADRRAAVHHVGPPDIAGGALGQFDVVIFPGGSGKAEAKALGEKGAKAVRAFVAEGGGYIGICAGAFLSSANYEWSLGLLNNKTIRGKLYARGGGTVKMELTDEGRRIFGDKRGLLDVRYKNGPMLLPAGVKGMPAFRPLAIFRSEICKYEEQKGTMVGTAAIIAAPFGKGRVLAISPHPESTRDLHFLIARGVQWAAGKLDPSGGRVAL